MEISTRINVDCNVILFKVEGKLDLAALLKHATETTQHPDFQPGMASIWNLLDADYQHLVGKDIESSQAVSRSSGDDRGAARVAVVVHDELGHGLVRMFQAMAGLAHIEYHITRSIPEAMQWLELPG